ncbi:MAG: hypothetical protein K2N55_01320 [Lachnospiraceae bacterium]|nr:hypothetical protein [Lachnospiraceae bacterium]
MLVIEGVDRRSLLQEEQENWERISIKEHMDIYENQGFDRKESMKKVASDRGISKRDVYQFLLSQKL